jgi:hypothetical protein
MAAKMEGRPPTVSRNPQPASQGKEQFRVFLGNLLVEKRNAPSLKAI